MLTNIQNAVVRVSRGAITRDALTIRELATSGVMKIEMLARRAVRIPEPLITGMTPRVAWTVGPMTQIPLGDGRVSSSRIITATSGGTIMVETHIQQVLDDTDEIMFQAMFLGCRVTQKSLTELGFTVVVTSSAPVAWWFGCMHANVVLRTRADLWDPTKVLSCSVVLGPLDQHICNRHLDTRAIETYTRQISSPDQGAFFIAWAMELGGFLRRDSEV